MPLPDSPGRKPLHHRNVDFRGFERDDGLFEVDAHLVDRRSYAIQPPAGERMVPAGEPIHDLWLRIVVTGDLEVREIVTASDTVPYSACHGGAAALQALVGARIAAGWTRRVKEALGGPRACTHLMELLLAIGTAAYQTVARVRLQRFDAPGRDGRPAKIDSCFAYASDGPLVRKLWPQHAPAASGADPSR